MKLFNIYNAVSVPKGKQISPWGALASLKKPPRMAYRLLKYGAQVSAEFDLIERQRVKLICEAAGVPEGSPAELKPDTPEYISFVQNFNNFLDNESDMDPVGISMDELINMLESETGNVLSETDLALLDPFFKDKVEVKTDLKVVG